MTKIQYFKIGLKIFNQNCACCVPFGSTPLSAGNTSTNFRLLLFLQESTWIRIPHRRSWCCYATWDSWFNATIIQDLGRYFLFCTL